MSELETLTEEHFPIQKRWLAKMMTIQFAIAAPSLFFGLLFYAFLNYFLNENELDLMPSLLVITIGAAVSSGLQCWFYKSSAKHFHFQMKREGVTLKHGIVFKQEKSIPYSRISSVFLRQGATDRWWDLASVVLKTGSQKSASKQPKAWNQAPGVYKDMIAFPGLEYDNALLLKDTFTRLVEISQDDDQEPVVNPVN